MNVAEEAKLEAAVTALEQALVRLRDTFVADIEANRADA